jgi:5'-3' exonuclease
MTKRVLIIDADVLLYKTASHHERAVNWGDGYWTWHCDENEVRQAVLDQLTVMLEDFYADSYKLCLTDSAGNFRKRILPTYKGQRTSVKKPLVLKAVRDWLIEEHSAYLKPGLEGDDCMGILATMKSPDERIIVSVDKDMFSIPGKFSRSGKASDIVEVTEDQANYQHMLQTLTGDQTDGYSGCPGMGPVKAKAILDCPDKDNMPRTMGELWYRVKEAFIKAGLTEQDALLQARVARILRASDYDFKKKEPILWTP